jgi:hypothetical protein
MVTNRNRQSPSGKVVLIPANTEVVRESRLGIGNDLDGWRPCHAATNPMDHLMIQRFVGTTSRSTMFQGSSRPLLGAQMSEPKRGCLSVIKGTREACSSRVIAQPHRVISMQVSPMRRTSGGAIVVVRGRESRSHGEGWQYVSFWIVEVFSNWEGSQ